MSGAGSRAGSRECGVGSSTAHDTAALHAEARLRVCYGVLVPVAAGPPLTLRAFLEDVLGIERRYAEERIQTILLNGLAVDGLDTVLPQGARLALSAAMPGVVGATLRKAGRYAAMRQGITHEQEACPQGSAPCAAHWVELRCFNDIARELGLSLLQRGVALPGDGLTPLLTALARQQDSAPPSGAPSLPVGCLWIFLGEEREPFCVRKRGGLLIGGGEGTFL